MTELVLAIAGTFVVEFAIGWVARYFFGKKKLNDAESQAKRILEEAEREGEELKKAKILEAKDEWYTQRENFERETREQRAELQRMEKRLYQREMNIDRKADLLKKKEQEFCLSCPNQSPKQPLYLS